MKTLVVNEALEAGADGVMFISDRKPQGDFLRALSARNGGVYYPRQIREMARDNTEDDQVVRRLLQDLSGRELDVLRGLTAGQSTAKLPLPL